MRIRFSLEAWSARAWLSIFKRAQHLKVCCSQYRQSDIFLSPIFCFFRCSLRFVSSLSLRHSHSLLFTPNECEWNKNWQSEKSVRNTHTHRDGRHNWPAVAAAATASAASSARKYIVYENNFIQSMQSHWTANIIFYSLNRNETNIEQISLAPKIWTSCVVHTEVSKTIFHKMQCAQVL